MSNDDPKGKLDRQIEENLRKVYQQKLEEEVPDRFANLLAQLKQQESSK